MQYNSSPHKNNVLQQTNNGNNREVMILSKNPSVVNKDILITNPAKKKMKCVKESSRIHNPPPVAVARRNARERNRVKQVNNGFATLRQHIPNSIAAAFESNAGRGGNKKLSKVETLRMAVEYIRTLEDLLASDESEQSNASSSSISVSSYSSPSPLSPALPTQANLGYNFTLASPSADDDDLSTNPTPPPHQYVRITNSNYQLIPIYEGNENLAPLADNILADPHLIEFDSDQDLSLFNSINTNASLSSEIYSDQSLSPPADRNKGFIPVFNTRVISSPMEEIKFRICPPDTIQNEIGSLEETVQVKNEVMEVMSWWEQQPQHSSLTRS